MPTHNLISSESTPTQPKPIGAGEAALLQLIPGLASLPVFAILAWMLAGKGIPNIFALALAILLIEVPVSWVIMIHHVRKEAGRFSLADAFPWRDPVPWWQFLVIGVPLIVFSMFMVAGIGPQVETALLHGFFGWVPEWFVMRPDPTMFNGLPRGLLISLWALMFFGMVIAGGITQEVYSRGFLLPRTQQLGLLAPAYNALYFAMLHTIAPWAWPVFFLMTVPWAYMVWWRRSIKIGLFIHVGMLALQWLGMTMVIFGVVKMPS